MLRRRALVGLAIAVCLTLTAAFAVVRGIAGFELPQPSGGYSIGRILTTLGPDLSVGLWYPARPARGPRAAYRPGSSGTLRERVTWALVTTSATVDAPAVDQKFPLLIYVPGWGQTKADNSAHIQNLVSHGFIVAALDDVRPLPAMDFSSAASYGRTVRWANRKVELEAARVSAAISRLEQSVGGGPADPVARHIDFARIGAFGYSFGGAVAAEAAVGDPRIRAAANLDGWTFGAAARDGVAKPFIIIGTGGPGVAASSTAQPAPADDRSLYEQRFDRANTHQIEAAFARYGGYLVQLDGTLHASFCDEALLPRLRPHRADGLMDGRRAYGITASYLTQFFDRFVNGKPAPLLINGAGAVAHQSHTASTDPAVHLDIWQPIHVVAR